MLNTSLTEKVKKTDLIRPNITKLAKAIGYNRSYVSQVWNRRRKSKPVQKAIAQALGISYEELWEE